MTNNNDLQARMVGLSETFTLGVGQLGMVAEALASSHGSSVIWGEPGPGQRRSSMAC